MASASVSGRPVSSKKRKPVANSPRYSVTPPPRRSQRGVKSAWSGELNASKNAAHMTSRIMASPSSWPDRSRPRRQKSSDARRRRSRTTTRRSPADGRIGFGSASDDQIHSAGNRNSTSPLLRSAQAYPVRSCRCCRFDTLTLALPRRSARGCGKAWAAEGMPGSGRRRTKTKCNPATARPGE